MSVVTELARRYRDIRQSTEALSASLAIDDYGAQSMPDASPVKWHLAHTSWFFETFVLEPHLKRYRSYQQAFRTLFNSYYNAVGEKHPRPERGLLSRPSYAEVLAYRTHVDAAMAEFLAQDQAAEADVASIVELGINHEQQHQELILTDVLHMLSRNPLSPAYSHELSSRLQSEALPFSWVEFDRGLVEVGHNGDG